MADLQHKDGFDYLSFPAPTGETKSLVLMFHGQGSTPKYYTATAEAFQKVSPDSDVIVVEGPVTMHASLEQRIEYNLTPDEELRTWIEPSQIQKQMLRTAFGKTVPVVEDLKKFAAARLAERKFGPEKLGLFGFSLGGAMAVMTGLGMRDACAAVVCHSGVVPPFIDVKSRPETLLVIGDKDFFYPQPPKEKSGLLRDIFMKVMARAGRLHDQSERRLRKNKVPFESFVVPELDHNMNKDSAAKSFEFLRSKLTP